jgi:hypothetical protein
LFRNVDGAAKPFPMDDWTQQYAGTSFAALVEEAKKAGP